MMIVWLNCCFNFWVFRRLGILDFVMKSVLYLTIFQLLLNVYCSFQKLNLWVLKLESR